MKKFKIVFTDEAIADIDRSFAWGKKKWGIEQARKWYRDLRSNIREKLRVVPLAVPIAPETEELGLKFAT
jgi:plasmid stabilization system protein ParE